MWDIHNIGIYRLTNNKNLRNQSICIKSITKNASGNTFSEFFKHKPVHSGQIADKHRGQQPSHLSIKRWLPILNPCVCRPREWSGRETLHDWLLYARWVSVHQKRVDVVDSQVDRGQVHAHRAEFNWQPVRHQVAELTKWQCVFSHYDLQPKGARDWQRLHIDIEQWKWVRNGNTIPESHRYYQLSSQIRPEQSSLAAVVHLFVK